MTALPPIPEVERSITPLDNTANSLYRTLVLPAEAASKAANAKDLLYPRVVGYLLLYTPNIAALATLKNVTSHPAIRRIKVDSKLSTSWESTM
ncbi:hypothetical protein BD309DRAFT_956027 [Dichomitus squalens]|nr:hypothetical protein BD309DRAFT_956027 [Dichomitus squalens]